MLSKFLDLLGLEPVFVIGGVTGIIDAVIALVVGLGLHLPATTAGLVDAVVIAVLGFVALIYTRSKVTPTASLPAPPPT